jgi:hypothetical protein
MGFKVQTLIGPAFGEANDHIDIEDCLADASLFERLYFKPSGKNLKSVQGKIRLVFHSITYEMDCYILIHTWTIFIGGIEQVLRGEKANGPLIYNDYVFNMTPIKTPRRKNGIKITCDWHRTADESSPPEDDIISRIEIADGFAFARQMLIAGRRTLAFYESLYASDTDFQTPDQREHIDIFIFWLSSLETAINELQLNS